MGQIGSWRLELQRNELTWSEENYRIFGVPLGTPMTYESFLGIVHPDDRNYVDTRWMASMAGEPYDIEHRILADGRVKWVREKAFPEYDEEGTLKGGFGITQDITERKRTEDALIESEARFRQVAESLPQLVWTCAADGPCDYLSPQWQRYTGKYGAEQLGYGWMEQLHPDDRERVIAQWRSTAARGENFEIAFRIRRHDGTYRWFRTLAVALRDEAGRVVKWFGSNTDIDDIMRTEEMLHQRTHELEQLSLTLEQRVLERTEELNVLNQELQQSQARLKRLSKDLLEAQEMERKKVAWELHDSIGSSLTAIKFRIENALRESGSQAMAALEKVVPVVQTAVMEAKRIQMNLRPSMLDDLGIVATTRWFFNQFRETYPEVQLEQHIKIEEDDVPNSLKTVIFRIFQEGLNNAARHSKSPAVSLYLWQSNRTLKLLIRDRGEGFDLTEVLSRTSHSRGLGLESMRERAELSGGRFVIATRQGKGTVIRVSWPIDSKS